MSIFSKLIIYYNFEHIDGCLIKKIGGIEMSKRVAGEGTIYFDKSMQRFVGQFPYKDLETGKTKRKKAGRRRCCSVFRLQSAGNCHFSHVLWACHAL